jgi:hypothetical protein
MKPKLKELKTISLEQFGKLRPDVWFWVREDDDGLQEIWKIYIVELLNPFGKQTYQISQNTLKYTDRKKRIKYSYFVLMLKDKLEES